MAKDQIIEALKDYEGTDFFVNDSLISFIENIPEQTPGVSKTFPDRALCRPILKPDSALS